MNGRRHGPGRPRKCENYIPPDGKRVVAFRVPNEMKTEFISRATRKGLTLQAYMQLALWDFMRREALEDAEIQAKIKGLTDGAG